MTVPRPRCAAPIRHTDHARSHSTGGDTSEVNGVGTCEACNYTKEAPGWRVTTIRERDGTHTSDVTTPTGTRHQSKAPPLPGPPLRPTSRIEMVFADCLAWDDAA